MPGQVDLLAIGILERLLGLTEQRLQLQGLKDVAMPPLSALASEHLADVEVDPTVMALGRFIWNNINKKVD